MSDQTQHPADDEPPLVIPVDDEPPIVMPVDEELPWAIEEEDLPPRRARRRRPRPPQPGFLEAVLLTLGFGAALFGTVIAVVLGAFAVLALAGGKDALKPVPGAEPGSVAAIPRPLADALAWSFPAGYAMGLIYTLVAIRIVVGRGWVQELGLRRLPPLHLLLGVLALPGFIIVSDTLARLLFRAFGMEHALDQSGALGDLFKGFHWSFAVLAIGVGPGLVEELWCRGFLGRGLVGRYGWVGGVVLTSMFFGALHVFPPPYVVVTGCMGLMLHYTYVTSRSLWVPVTVHLANNSLAALLAIGTIPGERMEAAMAAHPEAVVLLAVGLLLAAGSAMWVARGRVVYPVDYEGPIPHRGVMVPPAETGAEVVHHTAGGVPAWVTGGLVALTAALSAALLWFLLG